MSYMHIENLYKNQDILLFKECYALEKVYGSSAFISFSKNKIPKIHYFSGGEKHENFLKCFDTIDLEAKIDIINIDEFIIYGEVYGGKCQKMSSTYGPILKFVAFEVKIGDCWLSVPQAERFVRDLGLDFVDYVKIPTTLIALDSERDKPSVQAKKNGILEDKPREGIVIHPLIELHKNNGERIICKHKGKEFQERINQPKPQEVDPSKLEVLSNAQIIADEWVTNVRLEHVLQKLPPDIQIDKIPEIIKSMIEDIEREAKGEILESKEARKAISKKTVELFKQRMEILFRKEQ